MFYVPLLAMRVARWSFIVRPSPRIPQLWLLCRGLGVQCYCRRWTVASVPWSIKGFLGSATRFVLLSWSGGSFQTVCFHWKSLGEFLIPDVRRRPDMALRGSALCDPISTSCEVSSLLVASLWRTMRRIDHRCQSLLCDVDGISSLRHARWNGL